MHFIKYTNRRHLIKNSYSFFKIITIIFLLFPFNYVVSQTNFKEKTKQIELLQSKSYKNISQSFWSSNRMDSVTRSIYAEAYLANAKKEKDTTEIAEGYHMLIYAAKSYNLKLYTDSIISITKNNSNFNEPARAYLLKASNYALDGIYTKAFNALDKANFYAKSNENIKQVYEIKYIIARLKTNVGDYESALKNLIKIANHYKNKNKRSYIISSWAYANTLNLSKKPDSALATSKKIIPLSLQTKDSLMYNKLLLSTAISYYQKGHYTSSLDSIFKLREYNKRKKFSNDINVLMNLYQGKIYLKQKKNELAIKKFENVDSISNSKNYFHTSVRENYTLMYNYYKEKNDVKKQLHYINKLLVTDSILDSDLAYLVKNVNSKITTPNLILEKQKIIKSLKQNNGKKEIIISVLILFCVLLIIFLTRNINKKKLYKKRVKELNTKKKEQTYVIDNETTKRILDNLSKIEQSELFLNKDFNLSELSKKLNTNTSYISKIINQYKKKTFKNYLIDYRIKTLLKNLDEKPILRKYSIQALAESIGYTNASSFTRIFKNYMGISPSEYLKKKYK